MSNSNFADLGLSPPVVNALREQGLDEPFAVQRLAIPDVLGGADVLVKSPTGSGKTVAFAAPLVDRIQASARRPAGLVLAPTRELAMQIVEQTRPLARARALSIAAVYGGVGIEAQAKRARRAHVLVATPGRLLDLIGRGAVDLSNVQVLVLDEADRMLDMGFRPDVDRIVGRTPADRQTLFFSATLDGEVGRLAGAYTRDARRHEHAPPRSAARVEHRFVGVSPEDKVDAVVGELRRDRGGQTLVFVRTKHGADRLAKRLTRRGIEAAAIHGNKSQSQRTRALARFESGHTETLVATDVAARGIDVAGITRVINFDPPGDRDAYVHRVGRTARAGRAGVGVTLVLDDQVREVGKIARSLELRREFAEAGFEGGPRRRRQPRNGPRRRR
jgi:ATP-dependent RNA helicase RhlE